MEATSIEPDALRRVMRHVPSPVMVVTAAGRRESRGTTIGSFASVSLSPPLISFNIDRASQMHQVVEDAGRLAVHLPPREQSSLCAHFATPGQPGFEQLEAVDHRIDEHGVPVLENVLTVLHCRKYALYEAGDHSIVVGEVIKIEQKRNGEPLLYYDRSYCGIRAQMPAT